MGRWSVAVDDRLMEEVVRLSGARTKREALECALREYVRRRRVEELASLAGSDIVDMSVEELEKWRAAGIGPGDEA
ncbi:type II toxin-antitoxin system VapB family antitoxin [Deferrisoma sp.]